MHCFCVSSVCLKQGLDTTDKACCRVVRELLYADSDTQRHGDGPRPRRKRSFAQATDHLRRGCLPSFGKCMQNLCSTVINNRARARAVHNETKVQSKQRTLCFPET